MTKGFFHYFPTIEYKGTLVTNILARIKFRQSVAKNLATFYPYTVKEGERPDHVANFYYESPYYDWVVYLSNLTIDPYFEWPLSQQQFNDYIAAKYGSVANSQQQIVFWRNDYAGSDVILDLPAYSALSSVQRAYWSPITGDNGNTLGYERKHVDTTVDTNKIVEIACANTVAPVEGLRVTQGNPVTASGFVARANTSVVSLKHVQGAFANAACSCGTVTNVTTIADILPAAAASYFVPVSAFDYEDELNESRKHIRLVQASYLELIERDMKDLLRG